MKLTDLIPASEAQAGLEDVEKRLRERRYTSRTSFIVTAVFVVVQAGLAYNLKLPPVPKGCSFSHLIPCVTSPQVVLTFFAIVGALIWILYRYTGFLFTQSTEPFRYTFNISAFTAVASTPGERFPVAALDQLNLLRHDLTERLVRRVRRFSLLETPGAGEAANAKGPSPKSHFQIEGTYAIRNEDEANARGVWILHVWPRIRIGAESNPFTLAFPIRLPLELEDDDGNPQEKAGHSLQYQRLVERVYSSVATEIYKRIEIDLRDKMTLFPTSSLRALARYIEAEDFETSNTIEAYDRALEMYRRSLEELKTNWRHRWKASAGRRWPRLVAWQWTGIRSAMESEAKTRLGYSRCLIYRRLASAMAGRQYNTIFETRSMLEEARELFRLCYNSVVSSKEFKIPYLNDPVSKVNFARLKMADEFFPGQAQRRPQHERLYRYFRQCFCEAFAVSALALCYMADSKTADSFRQLAESLQINNDSNRLQVLLLIVRATLEPRLQRKVDFLDKARGFDPESEIVLHQFANCLDLLARDNDELTKARVEYLSGVYEAVLKVNPANIAALISQGYLFWLVAELEQARKKLEAGIELQKVVTQTFVGDLKYCLARVRVGLAFAEADKSDPPHLNRKKALRPLGQKALGLLRQAAIDYEEATIADPTVAAGYALGTRIAIAQNVYYDFFNAQMLARYRDYAAQADELSKHIHDEQLVIIFNTIRSYALNDYGIACLYYYLRFEVCPGEGSILRSSNLREAVSSFEKALELYPNQLINEYNLFLALGWANDERHYSKAKELADKSANQSPESLGEILPTLASSNARRFEEKQSELQKLDSQINENNDAREKAEAECYSHSSGREDGAYDEDITRVEAQLKQLREADSQTYDASTSSQLISPQKGEDRPYGTLSSPMPTQGGEVASDNVSGTQSKRASADTAPRTNGRWHSQVPEVELEKSEVRNPIANLENHLDELKAEQKLATARRLAGAENRLSQLGVSYDRMSRRRKHLEAEMKDLGEFFKKLEQSLLDCLVPTTALAPFAGKLSGDNINEFLYRKDMEWSAFGEIEVSSLTALARIWVSYPKDLISGSQNNILSSHAKKQAEGRKLSEHLLEKYYPEHFNLNQSLLDVIRNSEEVKYHEKVENRHITREREELLLKRLGSVIDNLIRRSLDYDSKSNSTKAQRWDRCQSVVTDCYDNRDGWSKERVYDEVISEYNKARDYCKEFASFHDSLASSHERRAKELAEQRDAEGGTDAGGREKAIEIGALILRERSEALRLEPKSPEYCDRFLTCLGRQWIAGNPYADPLAQRAVPNLIEVEIASDSMGDLRLTAADLPDEAQQTINGIRARLESDVGFTLPAVNFRDDRSLKRGQFRFLVRGVPLPVENLSLQPPLGKNWDTLTKRIEEVALEYAASLWTLQACCNKLRVMSVDGPESSDIQKDPDLLFALTWVLKSLLRERAPIADFPSIIVEFRRCRSRGLGLVSTAEEIRCLPQIRRGLPGNSLDAAAISMNLDLENRILAAIDLSGSEPIFNESPEIAREVRLLALNSKREAGERPAVLITGPEVRPFARKMIEDLKVAVLSSREALPALLMRT